MKNILLSFLLLFNFNAFATHLVGGEVVYSCLGGNQYEIKVIIYRECGPTNTNGTGFDGEGVITIYNANNNEVFAFQHGVAEEEFVVDEFTDECLTLPPDLCVEKGTYTVIVNLPNNGQAYKVVYQRCCRNEQVVNIDEPQDFGSSLVALIPPISGPACNNSPSFDSFPPLALCLGSDVSVSQSASDVDGDSLVYSLVSPFHGSSNFDPTGTYPPPYNQIPWADGYSEEYPMDSNPVLSIDSNSGLITGTPTQEGFYVIGIMVEEYRNGVYLGEILRDFRFLVIDCSSNGCGCTVENALNYDDDAIDDDGSCEFDGEVIGCSDIDAINFNPYSTFDDGSCEIIGCPYSIFLGYNPNFTIPDASLCVTIIVEGCTDINYIEYDPLANTDNSSCSTEKIYGCTDSSAFNFNAIANVNQISIQNINSNCIDAIPGCTDSLYFNFDAFANTNDGSCDSLIIFGCTDASSFNFNELANTDDDSCIPLVLGCTDSTYINYQYFANVDDGSCDLLIIIGCMNSTALNYDSLASVPHECQIEGCTVEVFPNYNSQATIEDFSCNINSTSYYGCIDSLSINYDVNANIDDGSCNIDETQIFGCTNPNAINYDINTIFNDGSCIYPVLGCTDLIALNFNELANTDDGSCDRLGCMDSLAFNFDAFANTQGECDYTICQLINMPLGWSMFSTYISADQMNVSTLLNPIIDDVELVKDNNGNPYFVEWGYNSIGDLQIGQGCQIKTNASVSLEICGDYAYPQDHPIELAAGWNMIGYLRLEPAATDAVLTEVLPELIIVKDYLGAAYLPEWNFNGIGDMIPGQGYHLKVSNETILYFHSNEEPYRTSTLDVIDAKTSHYNSVKATDNNMTIIIEDHAWDILPSANSEISAFDNSGIMVGSTRYTSPVTVLTLWGDDHTNESKVGLANFEASNFELWSDGDVKSFNIEKWSVGSNRYEVNAVNIAESISVTNTNEAELSHKKRVRTINVLGQEVNSNDYGYQTELLFDVYNDGSVEKRIRIKSKK